MRLIVSWTGAALGGRWSRSSSGFAGAAAARWGVSAARAFWSVLVLATVTSELEWTARRVPSGDGDKGVSVGEGARRQQRDLQERRGW
jgi:hypothetical protein